MWLCRLQRKVNGWMHLRTNLTKKRIKCTDSFTRTKQHARTHTNIQHTHLQIHTDKHKYKNTEARTRTNTHTPDVGGLRTLWVGLEPGKVGGSRSGGI